MIGSMAAAVIAMQSGVGDQVAHGGPIVGVLGAVTNVTMFLSPFLLVLLLLLFIVNLIKRDVTAVAVPAGGVEEPLVTSGDASPRPESSQQQETTFNKLTDLVSRDLIIPN